jgi:hypothetical protein
MVKKKKKFEEKKTECWKNGKTVLENKFISCNFKEKNGDNNFNFTKQVAIYEQQEFE